MATSKEDKLVRQITESMADYHFNPTIAGRLLVTHDLYIQDRLMKLIREVILQQATLYPHMWEQGRTSESLMLSSHLAEIIDLHEFEP